MIALRIDVDFAAGLLRGVPFMLDTLGRAGMRATFFVVAGRNRPADSFGRVLRPGYLGRLWKLGPVSILRSLGSGMAGDGEMLDSAEARDVLGRIVEEGHEVAVHGFDHAWWTDHAWTASTDELAPDMDRAFERVETLLGGGPYAWGSPSWRTTEEILRRLAGRGVPYFADCWGHEPFVTIDAQGRPIPGVHLPITAPAAEGLMLEEGLDERAAVARVLEGIRPERFAQVCMHDYFEGLLKPGVLEAFVAACVDRGIRTTTLRSAVESFRSAEELPFYGLTRGALPGFQGEVSRQAARAAGRGDVNGRRRPPRLLSV